MKNTVVLTVIALAMSAPASASVVIDANYRTSRTNVGSLINPDVAEAQTFTVQHTGKMTYAVVDLYLGGSTDAGVTLQIRRTVGLGVPSEAAIGPDVLAEKTVGSEGILFSRTTPVLFDFDDFSVSAGQLLSIVMTSNTTSGSYVWGGDFSFDYFNSPDGTYSGGQAYTKGRETGNVEFGPVSLCLFTCNNPSKVDFGFKTFVDTGASAVPEPATWLTMVLGFGAIGYAMRRRTNVNYKLA